MWWENLENNYSIKNINVMENNVDDNCDEMKNLQMDYQTYHPSSKEVFLSSDLGKIHKTRFHFQGQNSG